MTSGEMHFLIVVCAAFGAFMVAIGIETIVYHRWLHSKATSARKTRR